MKRLPGPALRALALLLATALALLGGCGGANENSVFEGGTQPRFQRLGFAPGDTSSQAFAVSGDGNVVVGASLDATNRVAFRWTEAQGLVALPLPGTMPDSEGHSVNNDGSVVGGNGILFDVQEAFTWTAAGGSVLVPDAPLGVKPRIVAAMSADGAQLFGYAGVLPQQAVRYRASDGLVGLGFLYSGPGEGSTITGVSSDGSVATGSSFINGAGDQRGLRWTEAGAMTALPPLPGDTLSGGWAVSAEGSVIVGWSCTVAACRAARWDSAGASVSALGSLAGKTDSFAYAASSNGAVIVGYATDGSGNDVAFIWDASNGMQDLRTVLVNAGLGPQLQGWTLLAATDISTDGHVIVGTGINPAGATEAWRVTVR